MSKSPEWGAAALKVSAAVAAGSLVVGQSAQAKYPEKSIKTKHVWNELEQDRIQHIAMMDRTVVLILQREKKAVKVGHPEKHKPVPNIYKGTKEHPVTFVIKPLTTLERRIEGCESGGPSPTDKPNNIRNSTGSSASGYFQFEPPLWNDFDNYPEAIDAPELVQNEKAEEVIQNQLKNTGPWSSSEYCWGT